MDDFTLEFGYDDYPFRLSYAAPNNVIIKEENLDYAIHKSLTNNMEEVIKFILEEYKVIDNVNREWNWFQVGDDGLFRLMFTSKFHGTLTRTNRDHWTITNLQWKYISKDLTAFNVLFGPKGNNDL